LKEAKGIGTPATRAEIIGGLKKQGFLITQGKNIVPTETALSLFGVLKQADPALVDPGVTAQLECLLDDVVVGKQEMVANSLANTRLKSSTAKRSSPGR
jgi:DNA topoisomerase-3